MEMNPTWLARLLRARAAVCSAGIPRLADHPSVRHQPQRKRPDDRRDHGRGKETMGAPLGPQRRGRGCDFQGHRQEADRCLCRDGLRGGRPLWAGDLSDGRSPKEGPSWRVATSRAATFNTIIDAARSSKSRQHSQGQRAHPPYDRVASS